MFGDVARRLCAFLWALSPLNDIGQSGRGHQDDEAKIVSDFFNALVIKLDPGHKMT